MGSLQEEKPEYSIVGFIVNIIFAGIFTLLFGVFTYVLIDHLSELFKWRIFIILGMLCAFAGSFHIYALIDPEHTNEKNDDAGMLSKHWALIFGGPGFCLILISNTFYLKVNEFMEGQEFEYGDLLIILSATTVYALVIYAFMTKDKESIFARYLKPWNLVGNTDRIAV